MKKTALTEKAYIALFFLLLVIPALSLNRDKEAVSEGENRVLKSFPEIISDGRFNTGFPSEFEEYLDDRIGFRNDLIYANAFLQYRVFHRMENPARYRLGPGGEFNIIENDMLKTYQHKNLLSDKKLNRITDGFERMNDYLSGKGCKLYYMQCWDKQSIYPEYFPESVLQYGDKSRTMQVLDALAEKTDVAVVPLIDIYNAQRDNYEIYSRFGEPVHWTDRGAFMSYRALMERINEDHGGRFRILGEEDYDIELSDCGMDFFGGAVYHSNISECFILKNPRAHEDDALFPDIGSYSGNKKIVYINESVGNDTKVLVIGNSFMADYILDDMAESFYETAMVWADPDSRIKEITEAYAPDIVVIEMVERYTDYDGIMGFE